MILKQGAKALPKLALRDHCRGILYLHLSIRQAFQASINTLTGILMHRHVSLLFSFLNSTPGNKGERRIGKLESSALFQHSSQLHHASTDTSQRHILPHLLHITHISPPGISCFQINYPGNASACESDFKAAKTALEQYKYIRACTYDCYPAITYNEFLARTWRRKKETQHENRTLIN